MRNTAPTPKVFNANYKAPTTSRTKGGGKSMRPLIFVGVIVLAGLLITRLPFLQIKYVDVHNSPSPAVTESAKSLIGHSIFSNRIKLVVRQTLEQHDALESFTCSRGLPATVRCEAKPREAQFVWKTNGKTYLLDKKGYIFAEASTETLPVLEDRANKTIAIGEQVTSEETIATYTQLLANLQQGGLTVGQLFITETFYQFAAVITARANKSFPTNPITVLFTTSYPISTQSTILTKVLDERATQIKERIDLRVPGNVYFY